MGDEVADDTGPVAAGGGGGDGGDAAPHQPPQPPRLRDQSAAAPTPTSPLLENETNTPTEEKRIRKKPKNVDVGWNVPHFVRNLHGLAHTVDFSLQAVAVCVTLQTGARRD